jgi:hypothetical protein
VICQRGSENRPVRATGFRASRKMPKIVADAAALFRNIAARDELGSHVRVG